MSATVETSHSRYWCIWYPEMKIPITRWVSSRQIACLSSTADPAQRLSRLGEVGHGRHVGGQLDADAAGHGVPVEQPPLDVLDRDGARVVVGLGSLVLGAVVPGGAAVVGVPDQGVQVEGFQTLS